MSYGEQTRNPYENDETPIEEDNTFACSCGDPKCRGFYGDPLNKRVGYAYYAAECENGHIANAIADGRNDAFDRR